MPQQIDVPGMGIVEFPDGMDDAAITAAIQSNMPVPEKPFLEKLGTFARKVYEDPPPSIAGARDIIKAAVPAATELTWGADPEAAREAAGTAAGAAMIGLPLAPTRAHGGIQAMRPPVRRPSPPPPPAAAGEAVTAGERLGVQVPRFLASEGTAVPQYAAGIANVPFAGEPIVQAARALPEQMGAARTRIAPTAASPELAGEQARTGLTGWIKEGSQRPVGEAYRAVDELIDPAVRVPLDNTRAMVGEIMAERTSARIPGRSKAVETVLAAVQDPAGMDYRGTKGLRSFLMERSPQELAVSGLAPTEVKRLTKALTDDLKIVVRESSPEALGAWQEANALARTTNRQRQMLSRITGTKGDVSPEQVFSRLEGYTGSSSKADLTRLRLAREAMGPAAWGEIGSAMIARMGKAPDGSFSPDRFVTAFGKLAPAARNELFTGQQHAALMDLFTLSSHVQRNLTRFQNPSGTSRGMFSGGFLGGALLDPISVIGGLVGTRLAAEALSRPAVVRAATAVTRAAMTRNPVTVRRAQERLQRVLIKAGLLQAGAQMQQDRRRQ